ncbi:TetR family transcriptional regulator C-terminal domain-containing protein [Alteromonas stellipolaris]|uniref:TetR family transcriptional regulator C-terminal domain-containing protein n=1 Tax=Alteromonas stellipolaris TaxID=233316 RepID=UPI0026E1E142|nr:TetR family transcriptional regulator C-terminal domain-containing protein [Alteromonas stellipolaris]MDO6538686.1 TetR family transcriptional regulator C-terminal domain-containing protein [Alteromonas stellipolaris]
MTKPTKTQANRAKTEAGILRAAEEVFAQKGFAGSSMDAVAQQAGISKQLILYYFPGKDKLYQAVLENMIDLWLEKMQFNDDPEASPASTIRQYIQQKIELSRDYPNGSKVFAHEIINGAPVLKTYLIENLKPAFERDVKIIERWIADGHIRPVDPKHLFFTIWAATQTYADFSTQIQLLLGKPALDQDDFNEATEFLCNFVLSALDAQH